MNSLRQIHLNIETRINHFTESPNWKIKYALFLSVFAIFFATPAYKALKTNFKLETWQRVQHQISHPLTPMRISDPASHAGKKTFRLTVPLIANVLRMNIYAVFAAQNILGIYFLYCIILLTLAILGDRISAFWIGLAFATVYIGRAAFIDIYSWFDSWAYLFLALAMLTKIRPGIFVFCSLAAWTDERAAMSLSLICLWWLIKEVSLVESGEPNKSCRFGPRYLTVALALALYFLGRHLLSAIYGLSTPTEGTNMFYRQMDFLAIGGWTFLEGLWLIVIAALLVMLQQKRYFLLAGILILIGAFCAGALMVYDITRSGAYLFPLVFICLHIIKQHESSISVIRKLVMSAAVVCVMFPAIFVMTYINPPTLWQKPIIAGALKHLVLLLKTYTI